MKNKFSDNLFIIAGLILLLISVYVYTLLAESGNYALPFIIFGCACGLFGHGMGSRLAKRAQQKDPELAKRVDIEVNDERNSKIRDLAKAKAFDMFIYIFGILLLLFAFMGIPTSAVLLLCLAYAAVIVFFIFNFKKQNKTM